MSSIGGINGSDPQLFALLQSSSGTRRSCDCDDAQSTGAQSTNGSASGGQATARSGGGLRAHLDDVLRQNGFDPDQLRQQLVRSLGGAGSAADATAPYSGLAPGSTVNAVA